MYICWVIKDTCARDSAGLRLLLDESPSGEPAGLVDQVLADRSG